MSKIIKKMQMDSLKANFDGVRDMVFLSVVGLDAITENKARLDLRKKGIRLQMVKNAIARRVLIDMGFTVEKAWGGATTVAWGGSSISDLAKEMEAFAKKNEKFVKAKSALADGSEVTFAQALKMPTRAEAIGRVAQLALSPASRLVGALRGPAGMVASQIKTISEKKEETAPADAAAPAA